MGLPNIPLGLEAKANKILSDLVIALDPIQKNYFQTSKKMWQGIKTPVLAPKDGNKVAPDKSLKPTDQKESWSDVAIPLPSTMEISTAVDVYEGPQGWGYVVRGEIEIAGKAWVKATNIGPEKYREHDWVEISSIDLSKRVIKK